MLLKQQQQTLDQKIWEFDVWVTPFITDIRSTDRFKHELGLIVEVLDSLCSNGHCPIDTNRFAADFVDRIFDHLDTNAHGENAVKTTAIVEKFLTSVSALLFLVTGKSDNNNKCQYPLYLRNQIGWNTIAKLRKSKNKAQIQYEDIPRVLDSASYMTRIARIYVANRELNSNASFKGVAQTLLFQFVNSLLIDEPSRKQLTAFISYYDNAKKIGEDPTILITPLVMFQVRGSVAASGGHEPEAILRRRMTEWGMVEEVDFNANDVILDVEAGVIIETGGDVEDKTPERKKTRAYDFVLPFRTPNWYPRIFIQSQFYAGDSGSVSHKNVDQTATSRRNATTLLAKAWPNSEKPVFLEYVDGAGYSASLNGDLKSLLSFDDTANFFQVRSAPIRLRRELQSIGFLTPLELAHAILKCSGSEAAVAVLLEKDGYPASEISRTFQVGVQKRLIELRAGKWMITEEFMPSVRRHLLLDLIACEGREYSTLDNVKGVALVPGYGPYHGLTLSELDSHVKDKFSTVWGSGFFGDLEFLCENSFVVLR